MIWLLFLQVASVAVPSSEAREAYEPYRQCLASQAGKLDVTSKTDVAIVDEARRACMGANLSAGTKALFAEMRATRSKDKAITNSAAYRARLEAEALKVLKGTSAVADGKQ